MIRAIESTSIVTTPLNRTPEPLSRQSTDSFETRMKGWDDMPPPRLARSNTSDLVERAVRTPLLSPENPPSANKDTLLPTNRQSPSTSPSPSYFPRLRPRISHRNLSVNTRSSSPRLPPATVIRPPNKPIPIFAVSANLNQHTQESLEAAGFDGWLSKPIDYTRLGLVLKGSFSEEARKMGRYSPKEPKAGGWFR